MKKEIKLKILSKALKKHGMNYEELDGFDDLHERVDEEPTDFIETCIEEAYKFAKERHDAVGKKDEQ